MLDPQFLDELQTVLIGGLTVWSIGRVVHWFIGRNDDAKRIHGRFIPEWIGGIYIGAGLLALLGSGPARVPAPPSLTLANFGVFIGLTAGWIHGSIRLRAFRAQEEESGPIRPNCLPDDENPYRPPRNSIQAAKE